MMTEPTEEKLNEMRLHGMKQAWLKQRAPGTDTSELGFDERFALLVDEEYLLRENRRRDRSLKAAKLRHPSACLEDFEQPKERGLDVALRNQLMTCKWGLDPQGCNFVR